MNNAIITGSLSAIAKQDGKSLAESFVNCDYMVLIDTSGSMSAQDSRNGKSRYDVACEELASLQNSLPGKIAVISFSDNSVFCPNGIPINLMSGTNLRGALEFARIADLPGIRLFVISDGYPDDPEGALRIAKTYKARIDTIYVGPESDNSGREFLNRLASQNHGQSVKAAQAKELSATVKKLLLKG